MLLLDLVCEFGGQHNGWQVDGNCLLCLGQESVDCTLLVKPITLHRQIQITVVIDGIPVRVEKRCVPVAKRFMPFRSMEWKANIATCNVQL